MHKNQWESTPTPARRDSREFMREYLGEVSPEKEHSVSLRQFRDMFQCDSARISQPGGRPTMYLILGWEKHTRHDPASRWVDGHGEERNFPYLAEKVVASGNTTEELMASAREYKRLTALTWEEYFEDFLE